MRTLAALLLPILLVSPAFAAKDDKTPEGPSAKRITGSESYMPTFGLRASISHGFQIAGVLAVDAGLDVPSAKSRKKVEALRPRLISEMRDAVLTYATLTYTVGQKPDADILKARLQKAVDNVLGEGEAKVALASVIVYTK